MNRNTDIPPEEFENIERYILKDMSLEEYEAFTLQIKNNPDLQNKTESVKLLLLSIQETVLEEKLDLFHNGISSSKKNKKDSSGKIIFMKRWMIAASMIVLVGLGALLFLNRETNEEKLFTAFYKPDPGLITAMGTTDNYLFEHAMIDYKTKKYDSALNTWQKLLKIDPANDTLNYFIGSALLAEDKADEAIPYFKKVTGHSSSYFLKDAYWYTGLALIKQEKITEAISNIEKSDHQNKEAVILKLKK